MGWSCTQKALDKIESIENQLSIKYPYITEGHHLIRGSWVFNGNNYFTEWGYVEHPDGRITGKVHKSTSNNKAIEVGRICILPDGTVNRFDNLPKDITK